MFYNTIKTQNPSEKGHQWFYPCLSESSSCSMVRASNLELLGL